MTYSQDAVTDIDAKYVKRRARMCLLGVAIPKFNIYTPFFPKTTILGDQFRRYLEIFSGKTALYVRRVNGP